MTSKYLFYISASLLLAAGIAQADEIADCTALGYKNKVKDCPSSVGQPLICPTSTALYSEKPCLCLTSSCRDYPLIKDKNGTFYVIGSGGSKKQVNSDWTMYFDGGEDKGLEKCTTGHGEDAVTYYRIIKCKDVPVNNAVPIYSNGVCITGCDRKVYPYNVHPGNLAGVVEDCQDSKGIYYGYTKCYDGWTKEDGYCNLNACNIWNYPYVSDPNLEENRGETTSCKVGGNSYYKYISCKSGFTQKGAVCYKLCEIDTSTCTSKVETYTDGGTSYTYNNWSCSFKKNQKCQIGDYASINGIKIGVIAHFADDVYGKNLIVYETLFPKTTWAEDLARSINTPIPDSLSLRYEGKRDTAILMKLKENNGYSYPAAEKAADYYPTNCPHNVCKKGEWFLPNTGGAMILYNNRYLLSHLVKTSDGTALFSGDYYTSAMTSQENGVNFAFVQAGLIQQWLKLFAFLVPSVLAF